MGSSPWSYYVPYQEDIGAAFRELQREVFDSGEYRKPYIDIGWLEQLDFFGASIEERNALYDSYGLTPLREPFEQLGATEFRAWLEDLNELSQFESLVDLLIVRCATEGTCSILDWIGLSSTPGLSHVCAVSEENLMNYFGTTQPTKEQIELREDFWDSIPRGHGFYLLMYKDNEPEEIFFAGYTYD